MSMAQDQDLDPYARAEQSGQRIAELTGVERHDVFVVLGSGFAAAADELGAAVAEVPLADAGFPTQRNRMHGTSMRSLKIDGLRVLVYLGRVHLYEGRTPAEVVHGVRAAGAAGCAVGILTNVSGSLRPEWGPGKRVVVRDHINLTGATPLEGPVPRAPRAGWFLDMSDAYDPDLRELMLQADSEAVEGVYVGTRGPQFETPSEIAMMANADADVVGMSTVLEIIAGHHWGMRMGAVSAVANLAAGLVGSLDASDVEVEAQRSARDFGAALRRSVAAVAQHWDRLGSRL